MNRTAEKVIAMYGEHAYVFCMYMASKFPSESLGYRYWLAVGDLIHRQGIQRDTELISR